MRPFIERALAKAARMNTDQLRALLGDLAEENGTMEAALDSMLDAIVVCDRDHRPSIWNKSAERMLGLHPIDAPERAIWLGVRDREFGDFIKDVLRGEDRVVDREFDLEAPGDRALRVAVSATPLVSRRRIVGTLLHLEDITEKRRREAQLRRAESLASLTTLAAGVAHEIKNPLGSISIHIQLLQRAMRKEGACMDESFPSMVDRHLGVVTEEIERLNRIVVDFLFAVRPMEMELREADPAQLLRDVAEFISPECEQAGIEVDLDIPDDVPAIPLDRRFMKQAILNLAKNAMSAMRSGGRLGFSLSASDELVRIAVSDTGTGMSPEVVSRIFEPYYTTKETGTGLGLTITFKIVREHRGEISVNSIPGKGSIFTISIPVPQREKRFLPSPESQEART
ncbi:MAG TPA: ATP-binding protein [Rectinemataceae bacterium]|nr:ATP-binding protein [Rectinemataceae bacterium]